MGKSEGSPLRVARYTDAIFFYVLPGLRIGAGNGGSGMPLPPHFFCGTSLLKVPDAAV